jgi:hypothetical protein
MIRRSIPSPPVGFRWTGDAPLEPGAVSPRGAWGFDCHRRRGAACCGLALEIPDRGCNVPGVQCVVKV